MSARAVLLKHALPLVPFDGWSEYALREAGKKAGLKTAEIKQAFPGGARELLDYYFAEADTALEKEFSAKDMSALRIPERIETLILARLAYFLPQRDAVRRAASNRALPWNAGAAAKSLYKSVDLMWHLAGDASTDFSYYTKRMTLAGLYTSTLLYWLNDDSENQAATAAFLKRRLKDIGTFGKWKKETSGRLRSAFRLPA